MGIQASSMQYNTKFKAIISDYHEMANSSVKFSENEALTISGDGQPLFKVFMQQNEFFLTPWQSKTWGRPINFIKALKRKSEKSQNNIDSESELEVKTQDSQSTCGIQHHQSAQPSEYDEVSYGIDQKQYFCAFIDKNTLIFSLENPIIYTQSISNNKSIIKYNSSSGIFTIPPGVFQIIIDIKAKIEVDPDKVKGVQAIVNTYIGGSIYSRLCGQMTITNEIPGTFQVNTFYVNKTSNALNININMIETNIQNITLTNVSVSIIGY